MKEKKCEITRKRLLFLLSIIMCIWFMSFETMDVKASNNITIAGVDMGYSDGSYFSKNGSACKCHGRGTCGEAPDCNCIVVSGTSQCYGWSMWVENKLFGYNEISKSSNFTTVVTNYSNCTGSGIYNKLNGKIGSGTHIRTLSSKKGYSHSVSVISYDQNGIDITDCNHSGKCQVDVRHYTWDGFANFMNGYGGISFVKACKNGIDISDPTVVDWYYDGATEYSDFRPVIRVSNPETVSYVHFYVKYTGGEYKRYDGIFNGGNAWYCDVASSDLGEGGSTIECAAYVQGKNGNDAKGYPYVPLLLENSDPAVVDWYYDGATDYSDFRPVIRVSNPETVSYVHFYVKYTGGEYKRYDGIFNGGNAWYCDVASSDLGEGGSTIECAAYVQGKNGNDAKGYPYVPLLLEKDDRSHDPIGKIDEITVSEGKIHIKGWVYDPDVTGDNLRTHVYVGGRAGENTAIGYDCGESNYERPDVNAKYSITGTHGFEYDIYTDLTGNQPVYVYAINKEKGQNVVVGYSNVNIPQDILKPEITNVEIRDKSPLGYTISCTVSDNVNVDRVQFPTWTQNNGQDDIFPDWDKQGTSSGNRTGSTYTYRVDVSKHNGETGKYNTHIYAFDTSGNCIRIPLDDIDLYSLHEYEHNLRLIEKKDATCVEKGLKIYACNRCGEIKREETDIDISNHTDNNEIRNEVEATCTHGGYTGDTYCKDCGTLISTGSKINKKEHVWGSGKVTQEPTCIMPGIKTYTCAECLGTKTEEIPATGMHENTEIRNAKEATCAEEGYTGDIYCKDCGTKLSSGKTIAKTDHIWDSGKITKTATCKESGTKTYTCTSCNTTKTEEIPATGNHQNTELRNVKEATCAQEGYTGDIYCKDCGTKLSSGKTIAKTEHTWDAGKVTKAATCTESGTKTYTCTSCNTTKTEEIPATGNHQNTELRNVKEATCAQEGYTGDTYCKDCGEKLSSGKTIAKTDHIWDSGRITKPATDTESGIKTYTCINCNTTRTEEIPATGEHLNTELRGAKSATCLEEGYTGDTYCKDCGTKLSSGTVIPKTGHIWDEGVVTKATTCAEKGIRTYTCSVCESTKIEEIPSTGHGTKITKFVKEATYTQEGYTGDIYCQDCGALLEEGRVLAKLEQPKQKAMPGEMINDKASNGVYKVLADGCSVEFVRQIVQSKAVKIPDTISIDGTVYTVTGISANAFKNNQLLRTAVIGRNVRRIGKQAFYNCKNLRTITIRTSMLTKKNVGAKAFKGTYKKVKVKVPAKQFKTYKKFLKSKGMGAKAIYKK